MEIKAFKFENSEEFKLGDTLDTVLDALKMMHVTLEDVKEQKGVKRVTFNNNGMNLFFVEDKFVGFMNVALSFNKDIGIILIDSNEIEYKYILANFTDYFTSEYKSLEELYAEGKIDEDDYDELIGEYTIYTSCLNIEDRECLIQVTETLSHSEILSFMSKDYRDIGNIELGGINVSKLVDYNPL